ncbi:MAG: hypothetical protein EOO51_04635 [Flavobacterium sp.]|nr:MAG: hypothetical protein EOO51_04635 [Flavobacterium sp.]
MINIMKRSELLASHSAVQEEVLQLQTDLYDADQHDFLPSKKQKAAYLDQFDARDFAKSTVTKHYKVLSVHEIDLRSYPKLLSAKLFKLLEHLDITSLVIVSHLKVNWFGNLRNSYAALQQSYANLAEITKTKNFCEALEISIDEVPRMIDIFFWIARCDSAAPEYLLFFDSKSRFAFFICQYGNLHTIEFETERLTPKLLLSVGLEEIKSRCYDKFGSNGKIEGRK